MPTRCFYHSADLDGQCSGAIVKYFTPDAVMYPINYGDPFPWDEIKSEDIVYMLDFGLQPFEEMERLIALLEKRFIWIDHHKSAIHDYVMRKPIHGSKCMARYDATKAACELTWEWFTFSPQIRPRCNPWQTLPNPSLIPCPLAVTLLGRYDVWDHSDPRTLPFQYRMRMEDLDPLKGKDAMKKWAMLFEDEWEWTVESETEGRGDVQMLIDEGKLLLRYEEQQNEKTCRAYAFETVLFVKVGYQEMKQGIIACNGNFTKFRAICINKGMTNSKVFDSIYDPSKHHLMITFCRLPLHKQTKDGWTVSLYSTRDDVDCSVIAKSFGGGGHKGAAGFQCDELPFKY